MPSMFKVLIKRDLLNFGIRVEVGVRVALSLDIGQIFGILLVSLKSRLHVGCQPTGV